MTESPTQAPAPAADASRVGLLADLLKKLCLAVSSMGLYAPDHPVAAKAVRDAYAALRTAFQTPDDALVLSSADGRFMIDGLHVELKNPTVARFAGLLDDIHVNTISFHPDIDEAEFGSFNRLLGMGPRKILESEGLSALLANSDIQHVSLEDASYVMVRENEKVVHRDAQVVEGAVLDHLAANAEIVNRLSREVLRKSEEHEWLIREIKNNPRTMADRIVHGLEVAINNDAAPNTADGEPLEALLHNIRAVGARLVDDDTGEVREGEEDLETAILRLEREVRTRSQKLVNSNAARNFIQEMMAVITSFSDRVKAKQISQEFLRGESGMRRAEHLLRSFADRAESKEAVLERLRDLIVDRGIDERLLIEFAESVGRARRQSGLSTTAEDRARDRRRRRHVTLHEGIARRLQDLSENAPKLQLAVDRVTLFFERKLEDREREFSRTTSALETRIRLRNMAMERVQQGIVMWDDDGAVEFINTPASERLGLQQGQSLDPDLRQSISTCSFPLTEPPPPPPGVQWTDAQRRFLLAIAMRIDDEDGLPTGILLRPDTSPPTPP